MWPMAALSRNRATVTGRTAGPPLMPAHGFACDQNTWRPVVPPRERDAAITDSAGGAG